MIEIQNIKKEPVQLIVRSRKSPKQFTLLHLPGTGAEKNIFYLEEERATEYIHRAEISGHIKTRIVANTFGTGEKHGNS